MELLKMNQTRNQTNSHSQEYMSYLKMKPSFERTIMYISLASCFFNLISLVIFKYSVSFKIKYNVYLACGLLVDVLTNLDNQFIYWSFRLFNRSNFLLCIFSLFIHQPVLRLCFCFSIAISLIISLDRLKAIQSPLSLKSGVTQRRMKMILALATTCSIVNTLFNFPLYKCSEDGRVDYRNAWSQRVDLQLTFSLFLLGVFIPTVLILGFNVRLVYVVYHKCYGNDQPSDSSRRSPTPALRATPTMTSISSKAASIKLYESESKAHKKAVKSAKLNCTIVFIITIPLIIVVFIQFWVYIDSLLKRPFSILILYIRSVVQPLLFTLLSFNNFLACFLINRKFRQNLLKPFYLMRVGKRRVMGYIKPKQKARL